jgi:hypothetical protein
VGRWRQQPRLRRGGASPAVLVGRGGVLQHEGAEGSERSTTKQRENKHRWSSPWWGTNCDGGSNFDGAGGSPTDGLDKRQGGTVQCHARSDWGKKRGWAAQ